MVEKASSDRYSREFTSNTEQEKIEKSRILLAGCGAGSSVAPHLARLGFGRKGELALADPDMVDESNLARQFYSEAQIGMNKAEALEGEIKRIDTEIKTRAIPEGITEENVEREVANYDLVIEMIDVGRPDLTYLVHSAAEKHRKPLITGLDVGEGVIVYAFDYRDPAQLPYRELLGLGPEITSGDVGKLNPLGISSQLVLGGVPERFNTLEQAQDYYLNLPVKETSRILEKLPREMHEVFHGLVNGEILEIPQSGIAAGLLGSELALYARELILGNEVKLAPDSERINLLERIKKE